MGQSRAGNHDASSIRAFQALHIQGWDGTDIGPGLGAFYIWIGEAETGRRNLHGALENYRKASEELQWPAGQLVPDDTRCQLATSYTKAGSVLTKMGGLQEASAAYEKALDIVTPHVSPERQDVPALYPAGDAYAGLGDVAAARARKASDAREQAQLWSDTSMMFAIRSSKRPELCSPLIDDIPFRAVAVQPDCVLRAARDA